MDPGVAVAIDGRVVSVMAFTVSGGKIVAIDSSVIPTAYDNWNSTHYSKATRRRAQDRRARPRVVPHTPELRAFARSSHLFRLRQVGWWPDAVAPCDDFASWSWCSRAIMMA